MNLKDYKLREAPNYIIFASKFRKKEFEKTHPSFDIVIDGSSKTVYCEQKEQRLWLGLVLNESTRCRKYQSKLLIDSTIDKERLDVIIKPNIMTKDIQYF